MFSEFDSKKKRELAMRKLASNPPLEGQDVVLTPSTAEELCLNMFLAGKLDFLITRMSFIIVKVNITMLIGRKQMDGTTDDDHEISIRNHLHLLKNTNISLF